MNDATDGQTDWSWLAGTYWIVTTRDLPALQLAGDGETLEWVADQTVWQIDGYKTGYFWGTTAVVMREEDEGRLRARLGPRITHMKLLGTVTPGGRVQMTFVAGGPVAPTVGFGQMVRQGADWVFEMQMSTDRLRQRVLHWAQMVQTRPGEPTWDQVPGFALSVPELLAGATPPRFADA